jgi:uncharacterized membrane protein YkvA (DUF1232 family)
VRRLIRRGFRRFVTAAGKTAADPQQLKRLVDAAVVKAAARGAFLSETRNELPAFFRLLRAWATRRYTAVPWKTIVLVTAAIAYFVSPFDAIPDWVPLAGFLDDVYVLRLVIRATRGEVASFRLWEAGQETVA